jgi:hypothetical protein
MFLIVIDYAGNNAGESMKNRILIAAILILPTALLAQPDREAFPTRARSAFRGKSAALQTVSAPRAQKGGPKDPRPPAKTPIPVPPHGHTPGASIRTSDLGYSATPTHDAHYANNDPGYAIVQDQSQTTILDPFPGIFVGPADKLPPPNPGLDGHASGRNAITPNAAARQGR